MPIRVLQIVTYMGYGGLETMLMNYYRNIDRDKVQFDFLVHRNFVTDYDREIESLGGRIYRLPRLNPLDIGYLKKLDSFFADHKEYRIVHSHLDCMSGIPLKYAAKNGIHVRIAHAHNSSQTKDYKYLAKKVFMRSIPKYATELFACGHEAGKWMFGSIEFTVLNNAIDAERYAYDEKKRKEIRAELNIPENALVIGHVGRFAPPKNHTFIVDLFDRITKMRNDSVLLLVGDGDLKAGIEEKVKKLGLSDKVVFTGLRSDVDRLLQAMDVFLFPSVYEGLPLSIIEAQAAGLPCLISDKVPDECRITDCVQQLSLDDPIEIWIQAVLNAGGTERKETLTLIRNAGYDIKTNAVKLQDYYLKRSNPANERE